MIRIGSVSVNSKVVLAPMAGITDRPFRKLCARFGTRLAISEMVTAKQDLWTSKKSRYRLASESDTSLRWIQIAGAEPAMMASAALAQQQQGAQIIDINMGCPAKKVCRRAAGSALLKDEKLVAEILSAVVKAVRVPVTLKIRTGWDQESRNAPAIARIAEDIGVSLISVHGRTRACRFNGVAEYDSIAAVVSEVSIPVIANGDISDIGKASSVLAQTGASGVMVGRAVRGKPWLCAQIDHHLCGLKPVITPDYRQLGQLIFDHVHALHEFYGETSGLRISRKHLGWYLEANDLNSEFRSHFNKIQTAQMQLDALANHFDLDWQQTEVIAA